MIEINNNQLVKGVLEDFFLKPDSIYNPVYLVGKTERLNELICTIELEYSRLFPAEKVKHISGATFTVELIEYDKNHIDRLDGCQKYRDCDLLIISDFDLIGHKRLTQHLLYTIVDSVLQKGKKVIATSSHLLADIEGLEERNRAQFEGGITLFLGK